MRPRPAWAALVDAAPVSSCSRGFPCLPRAKYMTDALAIVRTTTQSKIRVQNSGKWQLRRLTPRGCVRWLGTTPVTHKKSKISFTQHGPAPVRKERVGPKRQQADSVPKKRKSKTFVWLLPLALAGAGLWIVTSWGESGALPLISSPQKSLLGPTEFTPFSLANRESVTPTLAIFNLKPAAAASTAALQNRQAYEDLWRHGIWSVEFKQPQLQIARRYTPLPPQPLGNSNDGTSSGVAEGQDGTLSFLIRKEHLGEVSGYLHTLNDRSNIDIRGGYLNYAIPADVEEVVFLAGGTGIAPALQVAHALDQRAKEGGKRAKMRILWATRTRAECKGGVDSAVPVSAGRHEYIRPWTTGYFSLWSKDVPTSPAPAATETHIPSSRPISGQEDAGPLVQRLNAYSAGRDASSPGLDLSLSYYVDEEQKYITRASVGAALAASPGLPSVATAEGNAVNAKRRLVLVSGPEGFVAYTAGPKQRVRGGGERQGPVGGLLKGVSHEGWTVHKL